jgi:hypothetical protein
MRYYEWYCPDMACCQAHTPGRCERTLINGPNRYPFKREREPAQRFAPLG